MSASPAPLDPVALQALAEMTGGNAAFLASLIDSFCASAPELLAALRQALQQGDAAALRLAAHSLKSNSANFGATTLQQACRELELLGKANQLAEAAAWLAQVEAEYPHVEAALRKLQSEAGVEKTASNTPPFSPGG